MQILKTNLYNQGELRNDDDTIKNNFISDGLIIKETEIERLDSPLLAKYREKDIERLKDNRLKNLLNRINDGDMFINTGNYIEVVKGRVIKRPIIVNNSANFQRPIINEKNTILAGEDSRITVVFDYTSDDEIEGIHNGITQVYVENNALLNIIKIQRQNNLSYNFDYNITEVFGKGRVNYFTVELGSSKSVSSFYTKLKDRGSEGTLSSIYFGDKDKKIDLTYMMEHIGRHTISKIDSRGVLKDNARKIFSGSLKFNKGAVKAVGSEKENVLLLSPTARSQVIPALFCEEEDVSGEHAASAGRVDDNQLYYLMSRGLSLAEAKNLLVESALNPLIQEIPLADIREIINKEIQGRLYNE